MKPILMALAFGILSNGAAFAQSSDSNGVLAEGRKSIVDLVSEGFDIKAAVGPLIILQSDKALYGCSVGQAGPADLKAGLIPANKIPCAPIK